MVTQLTNAEIARRLPGAVPHKFDAIRKVWADEGLIRKMVRRSMSPPIKEASIWFNDCVGAWMWLVRQNVYTVRGFYFEHPEQAWRAMLLRYGVIRPKNRLFFRRRKSAKRDVVS